MLPLLRLLKDGKEHYLGEVVSSLADEFKLSPEEREQLLSSGQQTVIRNRAGWARTYLKKAGLLESTRRGYFRITERGQSVLKKRQERGPESLFIADRPEYRQMANGVRPILCAPLSAPPPLIALTSSVK